jgi:hypothetical protein
MEQRQLNAFGNLDGDVKLAIARDLQRQWSFVLAEPLPLNLQRFIDCLEQLPERRRGLTEQDQSA